MNFALSWQKPVELKNLHCYKKLGAYLKNKALSWKLRCLFKNHCTSFKNHKGACHKKRLRISPELPLLAFSFIPILFFVCFMRLFSNLALLQCRQHKSCFPTLACPSIWTKSKDIKKASITCLHMLHNYIRTENLKTNNQTFAAENKNLEAIFNPVV